MIQLSTGGAITLGVAFLGMVFAFCQTLLVQFQKRIDLQDATRKKQIEDLTQQLKATAESMTAINTTMPLEYVRREDFIRFGGVIEAKIDRLIDYVLKQGKGEPDASRD